MNKPTHNFEIVSSTTTHSVFKPFATHIDSKVNCTDIDHLEEQMAHLTITNGSTVIETQIDYMDLVYFCKDIHLKYIKLKTQMSESKLKSEKLEKSFKEVYNDGDI